MKTLRLPLLTLVAATAFSTCPSSTLMAQSDPQSSRQTNDLVAHAHPKAERSISLTLTGPGGKTLVFPLADLKAMPHKTITVYNEHAKANESYAGVPLPDLLTLIAVPTGKDLHGKALLLYLRAEGTDHYRVLYSLDEVDGAAHAGDVIVADSLNGSPLTTDGALKLVSTEDKNPARWVRNLATITVKSAE